MTARPLFRSPAHARAVMERYDAILARWPVAFERRTIPTRHGPTSVLTCGEAHRDPLVLLHGASSNALMWRTDVEHLARRHRVFAVDVIGEPGRSASVRPPWRGPAWGDWLGDVLDGLRLETTRLLGLSQGGWIALKLATSRPERIEKLVLLSPAGVVRDRLSFVLRALPLLLLGRRGVSALNRLVVGPQPIAPEALQFMDLIGTHTHPRTDPAPLFSDDEVRRLSMPVLLLGGEQDAIRDCRAIERRLRALLPRFESRLLPGFGHALVDVGPLVTSFLEALPAGPVPSPVRPVNR